MAGPGRSSERDDIHANDNMLSVAFVHESRKHRQQLSAKLIAHVRTAISVDVPWNLLQIKQ
jgi:hypothetical protein